MDKWQIVYYEDEYNYSEIEVFLNSLSISSRSKVLSWISLLEEKGPTLPRPFADLLEDGIHELRIKVQGENERILYFFLYKHYIILTHQFAKHVKKVPKAEIKKAQKCRDDIQKRYKNEKELIAFIEKQVKQGVGKNENSPAISKRTVKK
jgi:phage-related protein